jgi:HEAT repeat protein
MGRNCDPEWLQFLITELRADDAAIRYEAAIACGELGEEEAVCHLTKLTEDGDVEVQLAAIQALGKIGGSEARQHLEKCLSSSSEAVIQVASQALHELEVTIEPLSSHYVDYGELDD